MVGKQWVKSWGMYRWAGEACTYWHGDGKRIEEQLSKGLRDRLESNNKVQYNNTNKIVTSWITLLSPQGNFLIEIKQISWSSLIIFKKIIIPVQYCFKTLLHPKSIPQDIPSWFLILSMLSSVEHDPVSGRGDHGAGVDSRKSLQFLPKPEQDMVSDFWMKTEPGAGAGVRISVFTGVG